MNLLLKNVQIIDPKSKHNGKQKDVLIRSGKIEKITNNINAKVKQIEIAGMCLSPGWFDLKANFCQPGYEFKEDLNSGISAAKAGGFVGAAQVPFLNPITSNRTQVEYLRKFGKTLHFDLKAIGSLSQNAEGKVISEMYDMHEGGAIAFSDYHQDVSSLLLKKALEYLKVFDGLLISMPIDHSIAGDAHVHEGIYSTTLGLKGIPSIAEEIRIKRDLDLLRYTNGKIHFSGISSAKGVSLIKAAKKQGLKVTADVYIHNLLLNDESIMSLDSNIKVFPPVQTEKDRKALIKGLKEGTLDTVCSDHSPVNIEAKDLEFEYADFGIAAIQWMFPLLNHLGLSPELITEKLAYGSKNILKTESTPIEEGNDALLSLFNPNAKTDFSKGKSKSKNCPYGEHEMRGKVLGVFVDGELTLNV